MMVVFCDSTLGREKFLTRRHYSNVATHFVMLPLRERTLNLRISLYTVAFLAQEQCCFVSPHVFCNVRFFHRNYAFWLVKKCRICSQQNQVLVKV